MSYLLEGSVRTTTDRIGITVRLIETKTASQLWAGQYERDVQNLLTLQREVAEAIAGQITTSLGVTRSTVNADARRHSAIPEAYEHYLRGRYHLLRGTTDGTNKALEHFQRAIDLDASYALAYSGLADTFASLGNGGFRPMSDSHFLARAAALKALAIDGLLGEAHNSLAVITTEYYWEWADRRPPLQARDRAESQRRHSPPQLFLLSRLHGTTRGVNRVHRALEAPEPGVAGRAVPGGDEPVLGPSL